MGYLIKIGQAAVTAPLQFEVLDARNDAAPAFPNDKMSHHVNERHPSYSAWAEFCRETGLHELFYGDEDGLLRRHPGIVALTPEHLATIEAARERWEAKATLPPGFAADPKPQPDGTWARPDEGRYDHQLARLLWLEWWVRWALRHVKRPAIQNW